MNLFTVEEINLLDIYKQNTRENTIIEIDTTLDFMDTDMRELATRVLDRLYVMTDDEYIGLSIEAADE